MTLQPKNIGCFASLFVLHFCLLTNVHAGEVNVHTDDETKWKIYTLTQGTTVAQIAPDAGANLFSIKVDGVEYFHQPKPLSKLPGVNSGNPILYPMPNRVKGAKFTFNGKEFKFPPNGRGNFIHGLVNRAAWKVDRIRVDSGKVELRCKISFDEKSEPFKLFPVEHTFYMSVQVTDRAVKWTYEVDNQKGKEPVPFGVALHPYFVYQGSRAESFLTIPASHWMESTAQLPSGKLVPDSELDYKFNQPLNMQELKFDDVFFGMQQQKPTIIDFRETQRQVTITASEEFTHLVVWTPDRPDFGVESQTCSTDAHNLHSQGLEKAAHLQICEPGKSKKGWVEYQFKAAADKK